MGGTTSTHVANAFSQTIFVKVDAERRRVVESSAAVEATFGVEGFTGGGGLSASTSFEYNIIQVGFSRILPNEYLRFDVDMSGTDTAYISVFYIDETTHRPHWVSNALPRAEDKSVIVNAQGMLVDAKYGTIWQEEN